MEALLREWILMIAQGVTSLYKGIEGENETILEKLYIGPLEEISAYLRTDCKGLYFNYWTCQLRS